MKAEMAVRSISASISAWAARIAPRTISRVTGSQVVGCGRGALARGAGRSFSSESGIHAILDEGGRKRAARSSRQAIADRQRGEAHLGRLSRQGSDPLLS